jgi:hypothetical protein
MSPTSARMIGSCLPNRVRATRCLIRLGSRAVIVFGPGEALVGDTYTCDPNVVAPAKYKPIINGLNSWHAVCVKVGQPELPPSVTVQAWIN